MIRRTGTLDKEQLSHAINEIKGCPVSKEELQKLFIRLDLDGHSPPARGNPGAIRGNPGAIRWLFLVNSHTNATRIGWHLWEIDLRFAPGLPLGWCWALSSFSSLSSPDFPGASHCQAHLNAPLCMHHSMRLNWVIHVFFSGPCR